MSIIPFISPTDLSKFPYELQEAILLKLDYSDIISYCCVNSYTNQICKDLTFWKRKAILANLPPNLLTKDNPAIRYSQLMNYANCMKISDNFGLNCIGNAIDKDDLDVTRWLFNSLPELNLLDVTDIVLYAIQKHSREIALMLLPYLKSRLTTAMDHRIIEIALFRIISMSNRNGCPNIAEYAINTLSDIINVNDFNEYYN